MRELSQNAGHVIQPLEENPNTRDVMSGVVPGANVRVQYIHNTELVFPAVSRHGSMPISDTVRMKVLTGEAAGLPMIVGMEYLLEKGAFICCERDNVMLIFPGRQHRFEQVWPPGTIIVEAQISERGHLTVPVDYHNAPRPTQDEWDDVHRPIRTMHRQDLPRYHQQPPGTVNQATQTDPIVGGVIYTRRPKSTPDMRTTPQRTDAGPCGPTFSDNQGAATTRTGDCDTSPRRKAVFRKRLLPSDTDPTDLDGDAMNLGS